MNQLTDDQRNSVRSFLFEQGLTFKPLLDEMTDHLTCDIEEQLKDSKSFEVIFYETIQQLPANHFIKIQQDTMETINKRFNLARVLSLAALAMLLIATSFKIMHFPGGGELLLAAFTCMAASLLSGSLSGIFLNRDKKGTSYIMSVVVGTILLMAGYAFKILHLPGADQIIVLGVTVSIVSMVLTTLYIHRDSSGEGNLLTFLHEKYSPGIDRFLLLLLIPITLYKIFVVTTNGQDIVANIALIVVIYGSGLQFISLTWRSLEKHAAHNNLFNVIVIVTAVVCLVSPLMGNLVPYFIRLVFVTLFSVLAGILALRLDNEKSVTSYIAYLPPVLFVVLALVKINILPSFAGNAPLNVILICVMATGIFVNRKNEVIKTYLILSLSAYLLEFNARII